MRESRPLRAVVDARLFSGRGSLLGDQGRRRRWWELTLECGHKVVRDARYRQGAKPKAGGRGWGTIAVSEVLPAPRRAGCNDCPQPRRKDEAEATPRL